MKPEQEERCTLCVCTGTVGLVSRYKDEQSKNRRLTSLTCYIPSHHALSFTWTYPAYLVPPVLSLWRSLTSLPSEGRSASWWFWGAKQERAGRSITVNTLKRSSTRYSTAWTRVSLRHWLTTPRRQTIKAWSRLFCLTFCRTGNSRRAGEETHLPYHH